MAFINKSFQYLYNKYPNWQKNKYLKQENFCKRIIKRHRFMIKLYKTYMNYPFHSVKSAFSPLWPHAILILQEISRPFSGQERS